MALKHELLDKIVAYVEGRASIDDLVDWLVLHVQAVADSADEQLQAFNGEAWILISELDAELRDAQSVKAALNELVRSPIEVSWQLLRDNTGQFREEAVLSAFVEPTASADEAVLSTLLSDPTTRDQESPSDDRGEVNINIDTATSINITIDVAQSRIDTPTTYSVLVST
jgi:hypothetical protein